MLSRSRRPTRARIRYVRRKPPTLNYPQLQKEVRRLSEMGLIIKDSRFFDKAQQTRRV